MAFDLSDLRERVEDIEVCADEEVAAWSARESAPRGLVELWTSVSEGASNLAADLRALEEWRDGSAVCPNEED